jgi:predicted PurR-regulated permease PerM
MDSQASPPSHARRMTMLAALWLFAVLLLVIFRTAVLPFALAALVAYVVAPIVDRLAAVRLKGRTLPRWGALLLVYAVFFVLAYAFFVALVPQLYKELARISRDLLSSAQSLTPAKTRELASKVELWLSDHGLPVALTSRTLDESGGPFNVSVDLEQVIRDFASRVSGFIEGNVVNIFRTSQVVLGGMLASVFMVFFMLMVAAFFSIDASRIGKYVSTLVPPELREDAQQLISRVDRSLAGVVRGQLTICLVNGLLTLIGLLLFRVKFAFLLASVATFFSLVPIFGTIISSVPIVLVALGTGGWKSALAMLVWITGIHALEAYFLNPKIMGQAARIHPVVVAFALLAGERTYGILGALLAAPVAAIFVACFEFVRQKAQPS